MKNKIKYKELGRFSIAGVQFGDYQTLNEKEFKPGVSLSLFWEKKNKFDPNAIRVELNGVKLGYVPRGVQYGFDIQTSIHDLVARKIKPICILVAYNKGNPTWALFSAKIMIPEHVNMESLDQISDPDEMSWHPGDPYFYGDKDGNYYE